jgi:hypothetical protein
MANFESGVSRYIRARATVEVAFPVDMKGSADISCSQCPYFSRPSRVCRLNGELAAYPEKYVGDWCPLEIVDEEDEGFKDFDFDFEV